MVKWSRYRPSVAQRVGRGRALLFHDRGTRRGWVISSTPRPHFTPGKEPVPILQEAGWAPGPVWTGGRSRPHRDSIPDRPARSQSLYRLSYPGHPTNNIPVLYTSMRSDKQCPCTVYKHEARQIISLHYIQAWGPTNNIPVLYTSTRSDK